jgi:hypothetical protein
MRKFIYIGLSSSALQKKCPQQLQKIWQQWILATYLESIPMIEGL